MNEQIATLKEPLTLQYLDLCDGCKAPIEECCCAEVEAEREAERGKYCDTCGSDAAEDYGNCPYRMKRNGGYKSGNCPMLTGMF